MGGVGNNVATAISKMCGTEGLTVELRSFIGDDIYGDVILKDLTKRNQPISGIQVLPGSQTALYVSVNNAKKDMELAMADMNILNVSKFLWNEICTKSSGPPPK